MMNPVVATGRILMVAEEEGEVALGEVVRAGTMAPRRWSHPESQEKYPTWRGENTGERDSLSQQAAPVALLICGPATSRPAQPPPLGTRGPAGDGATSTERWRCVGTGRRWCRLAPAALRGGGGARWDDLLGGGATSTERRRSAERGPAHLVPVGLRGQRRRWEAGGVAGAGGEARWRRSGAPTEHGPAAASPGPRRAAGRRRGSLGRWRRRGGDEHGPTAVSPGARGAAGLKAEVGSRGGGEVWPEAEASLGRRRRRRGPDETRR